MISRRTALGIIAAATTIGSSGVALAKQKEHLNLMNPLIFAGTHIGQLSWRMTGLDNPV